MDFATRLPISKNWRQSNKYNAILVIVDRLTKMVHYIATKTIITTPNLAKIIIKTIV